MKTNVTVRKKVLQPCDVDTAKLWLSHYVNWRVVDNDANALLQSIEIEQRYQLPFWDALIIQAANRAGTPILYSEDLSHDQRYGDVRVKNPFIATTYKKVVFNGRTRKIYPGTNQTTSWPREARPW